MAAPGHGAVVVGVGPSTEALTVVRTAAGEAAAHDRPLHLLHAFNWAATSGPAPAGGTRTDAEDLLERASQIAAAAAPEVPVSGEIVEGSPVEALLRAADAAFLVALGDGGMATCSACVPADAPAVELAARAGCPVLIGRTEPAPPGPLLVGYDGSPGSRATLGYAFDCAERRGARLLAVRVVEPDRGDDDGVLEEAVNRHAARHPRVAASCQTVRGDPRTVLLDRSRSAQLALVGARGDGPVQSSLGEVSQSLLYHSPAPLIVVRGLDPDARDGS
ncbi:universal stress protein [Micromonospora sp. WMMD1128]|uniref:universal stress protein n=1 Tax=unclassified Micromonospora TaxID=2617518 RepID=UPI00248BD4B6|nr:MULTISPECIES: universal stress protein [unclassified Micromonospora]WBB72025.1 universal stress protein [Micromonospora sp. WMMD1128]WFE34518.1 universal stress protein [Micromonospora sp. WMMD975]